MKKFINAVDDFLAEGLRGFASANAGMVRLSENPTFLARANGPISGKVALVSGGGSGHEPLHAGFIGEGMLDAACPGQVFTSPTPDQVQAASEAVDGGAGILFIVKNYTGDVMNFEMAAELVGDGAATVLVNDDVAVEDSLHTSGRRGVAGTLVVEKIVGAAAEAGRNLSDLANLGNRVNAATRSMGVALTSCTVPEAGKPMFEISDNEMEMGVGIHGEPGRRRMSLTSADEIAQSLVGAVLEDLKPARGQRVLLLVNGMGGNTADRARPDVRRRGACARAVRRGGRAGAGGELRHLAGHGGLLHHVDCPGRRNDVPLGRPGEDALPALGRVRPPARRAGTPGAGPTQRSA